MNTNYYLPIGSIVLLKGGTKKLMIFGIMQSDQSDALSEEYDYIAVPYPEGNMGQEYQYLFNADDIATVVSHGYEDTERTEFLNKLDEYFKNN